MTTDPNSKTDNFQEQLKESSKPLITKMNQLLDDMDACIKPEYESRCCKSATKIYNHIMKIHLMIHTFRCCENALVLLHALIDYHKNNEMFGFLNVQKAFAKRRGDTRMEGVIIFTRLLAYRKFEAFFMFLKKTMAMCDDSKSIRDIIPDHISCQQFIDANLKAVKDAIGKIDRTIHPITKK